MTHWIILISRVKGKVIVNQTKILQVFLIQNPVMLRENITLTMMSEKQYWFVRQLHE